jgi:ABC-2 type transport system permease protein
MFLRKSRELIKILIKFRVSRYRMFKADTILNILSSLAYLAANLLFWYLITDTGFFIEGWSYKDILVFIAFSELFFGLDSAVFSVISRFWNLIYTGALDTHLMRPLDPRMRLIILNIDYMGILSSFLTFVIILLISCIKLNIILVFSGILVVFTANVVLALIRLTMSYAAFWIGKMDAMSELADCMTLFNKYPLVIMPKAVRILLKTVLPFYFFSTFSAEAVTGKISYETAGLGLFGIFISLIFWSIINRIIWKKGTARYEGING